MRIQKKKKIRIKNLIDTVIIIKFTSRLGSPKIRWNGFAYLSYIFLKINILDSQDKKKKNIFGKKSNSKICHNR